MKVDHNRDYEGYMELQRVDLLVCNAIETAMQQDGVSRSDLARRLGRSPAWVTKALRGGHNWTINSMVRFGLALGRGWRMPIVQKPRYRVHFCASGSKTLCGLSTHPRDCPKTKRGMPRTVWFTTVFSGTTCGSCWRIGRKLRVPLNG